MAIILAVSAKMKITCENKNENAAIAVDLSTAWRSGHGCVSLGNNKINLGWLRRLAELRLEQAFSMNADSAEVYSTAWPLTHETPCSVKAGLSFIHVASCFSELSR